MNDKAGLWHIETAGQLLSKLHSDYSRVQQDPRNPFPVYDFFVTAYHMHEWAARTEAEKRALEAEPLIRVAGEIATRAKHLRGDNPKWVQLVGMGSRMPGPLFRSPRGIPTVLWVALQDPSSTPLGRDRVSALDLAQCLIDRWTRWISEGR
jgi:hypothetical protein